MKKNVAEIPLVYPVDQRPHDYHPITLGPDPSLQRWRSAAENCGKL